MTETAARALTDAVAGLGPRERCQVINLLEPFPGADAVRIGTEVAHQSDGTSCGSAVLAVMLAYLDPHLAYWLITGLLIPGHRPAGLAGLERDVAQDSSHTRWRSLQLVLKDRTNARTVARVLTWPHQLGTPPWGLARVASSAVGIPLRVHLVDDTREVGGAADVLDRLLLTQPVVPAYTGTALRGLGRIFWWAVIPRHVILLRSGDGGGYRVYEPSSGRVHVVRRDELVAPRGARRRLRAYGSWSRLIALVGPAVAAGSERSVG